MEGRWVLQSQLVMSFQFLVFSFWIGLVEGSLIILFRFGCKSTTNENNIYTMPSKQERARKARIKAQRRHSQTDMVKEERALMRRQMTEEDSDSENETEDYVFNLFEFHQKVIQMYIMMETSFVRQALFEERKKRNHVFHVQFSRFYTNYDPESKKFGKSEEFPYKLPFVVAQKAAGQLLRLKGMRQLW